MLFSKQDDGEEDDSDVLIKPLSTDRISSILDEMELKYEQDDDGDYVVGFEGGAVFTCFKSKSEDVLVVNGQCNTCIRSTQVQDAYAFVNAWNRRTLFLKAYVINHKYGDYRIVFECAMDYEYGLTDKQLALHLVVAFDMGDQLIQEVNEYFSNNDQSDDSGSSDDENQGNTRLLQ